jgi:predicted outer membrane repeat protein
MFHSRPARKVRAYRPHLEVLEDRTLLSTYLVDHLADDMVGTGTSGSLRYAITHAMDGDTITFGVTGTINLSGALPNLTHNISINGPGPDLLTVRRDTGGDYSVFYVGRSVVISGLTIANGASSIGGGISDVGTLTLNNVAINGNSASGQGGGIFVGSDSSATLTVTNSSLSGNHSGVAGGAIFFRSFYGVLTITGCTFSGNSSTYGGAIEFEGRGDVSNSTFSGNTAAFGGGAIAESSGFTDTGVSSSTLSGNSAVEFGGGIYGAGIGIYNTIIAGNTSSGGEDDIYGYVNDVGDNLIGVDPLLGPLQANGGPTQTMALLPGSPALNTGDPYLLGTPDQRGVIRNGGVNIGAYQASASAFVLTAPATVTAGTAFDVTVKAMDPFGQVARGYTGTVTFSSTDPNPAAVLPAAYPFTLGDAGQHTFAGGVTLLTAGSRAVTATDTVTNSITGSATVTVTPATADHLLFLQQPTDIAAGQTMSPVIVEVVDQYGNVETSNNTDTITLSIGVNPSGGTLSGTLTVTVVNGVASFSDLSIDVAGMGYTLHATIGSGVPDLDSDPFDISL